MCSVGINDGLETKLSFTVENGDNNVESLLLTDALSDYCLDM